MEIDWYDSCFITHESAAQSHWVDGLQALVPSRSRHCRPPNFEDLTCSHLIDGCEHLPSIFCRNSNNPDVLWVTKCKKPPSRRKAEEKGASSCHLAGMMSYKPQSQCLLQSRNSKEWKTMDLHIQHYRPATSAISPVVVVTHPNQPALQIVFGKPRIGTSGRKLHQDSMESCTNLRWASHRQAVRSFLWLG